MLILFRIHKWKTTKRLVSKEIASISNYFFVNVYICAQSLWHSAAYFYTMEISYIFIYLVIRWLFFTEVGSVLVFPFYFQCTNFHCHVCIIKYFSCVVWHCILEVSYFITAVIKFQFKPLSSPYIAMLCLTLLTATG